MPPIYTVAGDVDVPSQHPVIRLVNADGTDFSGGGGGTSTSQKVLVFDGGAKSVFLGAYYPSAATELGTFLWEFFFRFDGITHVNAQGYLISGSAGGAHPILFGHRPEGGGNILGPGGVITPLNNGDYLAQVGEWLDAAVGWDGEVVYQWANGILTSITPFVGPRHRADGAGEEMMYIGGSDHSNLQGALYSYGGVENALITDAMPNLSPGVIGSAYTPEVVKGRVAGDKSQIALRSTTGDLSYGGMSIPDTGDGYNGSLHPGKVVGHLPDGPPVYELDSTFPGNVFPVTRTRTPPTSDAVPAGAAAFDSFSRDDSIPFFAQYEYPYVKTELGFTEGGSLGPLAWQNDNVNRPGNMWGVFDGKAVFTGTFWGSTWVELDSPDMDIRVTRANCGGFNIASSSDHFCSMQDNDVGICLRVTDDSNQLYVQIFHLSSGANFARLYSLVGGVTTQLGTDMNLPNYTWTTLRGECVGTDVNIYVDTHLVGTVADVTDNATGVGGGMRQNAQVQATGVRWGAFSAYTTPPVTPMAPAAPAIGTATAGDGTATANWLAAVNNGSTVTAYHVKRYDASDDTLLDTTNVGNVLTSGPITSANDTGVYFKVSATNGVGTGPDSVASNTVTPTAAGGGAFTPADLTGIVRWGDPSGLSTGALASYPDSSGFGTDLAQATGSKQPTVVASGLSGGNVVRFDGVDDFLVSSNFTSPPAQPNTAVLVVKLNGVPSNTAKLIDGGGAGRNALYVDPDAFTGVREALYIFAGAGGGSASLTAHAPADAWVIILCEFNGSSSKYYVNGGTAATGVATAGDSNSQGRITLACDSGQGAHFVNGDYADDMFINGLLSVDDKNAIGDYLTTKYPALTWTTVTA